MSTIKDAALDLARRGWLVFPVRPRSKVPATKNGFKAASSVRSEVAELFAGKDGHNLGVATGPDSGIWVLDLDGSEGQEALDRLESRYGELPETVSTKTGGGGRHLYWKTNGEPVKNRTKISGAPIDVRGAGGYVIAPPSRHSSGNCYEWENEGDPAEAPTWLVDFVLGRDLAELELSSGEGRGFSFAEDLDLESDSGAKEGQRHQRALALIGSALARGKDSTTVARIAIDWARRCSPPFPDAEVLKIVSDLGRKQGGKVEASADEIDRERLPVSPSFPVLDPEAYHGIAGELVQTIEPESEADPAALLTSILVYFGNLVGRLPHYVVEGIMHHANLFAVLVGATGKGRKGTSEGRSRSVLRSVDDDWVDNRITTGLVSGEGLIWSVRDPIYKTEVVRKDKEVVGHREVLDDPGVEDKRLLVVESEFASVLKVCRRDTNTLSPILRLCWDSGDLRTLAKQSPAQSTGAHVSILGHITGEELKRALAEVELFSGFANRFIWVVVRRSKLLPDGGQDLDLSSFAEQLIKTVKHARTISRMRRDESSSKLWRNIYHELSQGSGGLLGAVTNRAEAQVLRLGMIYALLDESSVIRVEHLRAAYAVWRYAQRSAEIIFGTSSGDSLADKLLQFIKGEPGIKRRDLRRKFPTSKTNESILQALARLRDQGLAHPVVQKVTKPSERWFPGPAPDDKFARSLRSSSSAADDNDDSANSHPAKKDLADLELAEPPSEGMEEFTI